MSPIGTRIVGAFGTLDLDGRMVDGEVLGESRLEGGKGFAAISAGDQRGMQRDQCA